jgi:hypothetical protein
VTTAADAAAGQAFARLAEFLADDRLTAVVASAEQALPGTGAQEASEVARSAGFEPALLEAALLIRRHLGRLNDLVHASAISLALPIILEDGERLTNRPSLAAGNDPTRPFDLETDRRVAEFKVGIWSGSGTDAMRKRAVFHDLVNLAADTSGRRVELYVAGSQPLRFLSGVAQHSTMGPGPRRRFGIAAAQAAGLARDGGESQLTDELLGQVVAAVRPARPAGHGASWEALVPVQAEVTGWVKDGLTLVKIGELVERRGIAVPYRTLVRFAAAECGYSSSRQQVTVPVADGKPGEEVQIDFGYLGMIGDGDRRRKLHALVFTAVLSRYCFVFLTFSQTTAAVIAGCEAAWSFFGGTFKVLIPEYVPRNIFRVVCPAALCARRRCSLVHDGAGGRRRAHNFQRDASQLSRVSSDCQTGLPRGAAEVPGGSRARSASCFALVLISAYRLVVLRSACPSQPRMTLISTPASRRWTAAVCRKVCGVTVRSVRGSSSRAACRRTIL